jgi:hypothetical protein
MPLQLRRGTTAERLSIVPLPGEPIYDTDLDTIFIGNGIAAGGISAITGITSEDAQDIVGQMFLNGQHDGLIFTYGSTQDVANRIDVRLDLSSYDGELAASAFRGSLYANDSTLLVNADTGIINASAISGTFGGPVAASQMTTATLNADNMFGILTGDMIGSVFSDSSTLLVNGVDGSINLDGTVKGDIIPAGNELYDLGSNSNRFKDLYLSGSSIFLGNATITSTGSAVNLPAGSTINGTPIGTGTGTGDGVVAGSNYNINIVGDDSTLIVDSDLKIFTGSLIGDVRGSVFADNSTVLIDAVSGTITGNFVGNLTTSLISSADSSPILFGVPTLFSSRITVDDDITMNNGGTLLLNSNESTSNLEIATHSDSDLPGVILMRRSRGTEALPTALQTNDRIHQLNFNAFDGSNYINAASIQARITGTISTGVVPTSLRFFINDTVGDEVECLRIDEVGSIRVFRSLNCIASDGVNNFSNLRLVNHHNSGSDACNLQFTRGRGTLDSPSTVLNGDPIYDTLYTAYDGSSYSFSASIRGVVDGTVSTGVVPGRLDFRFRNSAGGLTVGNQFNAVKSVFNTMLQLPTFADETAADAAIGGAGNRVNGMMYYDTAVGAVRAVVAGAWASL